MISDEYRDWINNKILDYLPSSKVIMGNNVGFRCPFCGDSQKNKSKHRGCYFLNTAKYYCYNCGTSLDGWSFLTKISGEDYASLKKEYLGIKYNGRQYTTSLSAGQDIRQTKNVFDVKSVLSSKYKQPLTKAAIEYLTKRRVLEAPFYKDPLFSCTNRKGNEFILIPWVINGIDGYYQVNDFQRLNPNGQKYIFPKGTEKLIYGLDNIDINWPYIICFEGVYDSLFVKNAIAIGGVHLTDVQFEMIRKRYPRHQIVMALDNDKAGLKGSVKLLHDRRYNFKFFKWFNAGTIEKDINDFVLAKDNVNIFTKTNELEACIIDSVMMRLFLIQQGIQF